MKRTPSFQTLAWPAFLVAFCFLFLSGCGRNDVRVYSVPKENPEVETASDNTQPHLHWKLPEGWEEREGDQMRLARFAVRGKEGGGAEVSIIPLGDFGRSGGTKDQLLNIWREQLKLAPLEPEAVTNSAVPIAIGSSQGELYEMLSEQAVMDEKKGRTLVALLNANDGLWIFKMTGHADFVLQQKPEFESFLKSVSIDKSAGTPAPHFVTTNSKRVPSSEDSEAPRKPNWKIPDGWTEQPAPQMLLGKFEVQAEGGRAEITISTFPGDGGGLLANVNRWRKQVGLKEFVEADLVKNVAA